MKKKQKNYCKIGAKITQKEREVMMIVLHAQMNYYIYNGTYLLGWQ